MKNTFFKILIFTVSSLLLLGGCGASVKETTYDDPNLLFEDNFDGNTLDSKKWSRCPEWARQGKSFWKDELSYVDGEGHLVLRMEWDEETQLVNCGAVRTLGKFEAGYAYYEASIKFPVAPGTWGAFWMMAGNVSSEENGAKDGVEIDIVESIGNEEGKYQHALHWDGYGDAHKSFDAKRLQVVDIYDGNFHTFGLLRSEEYYIFYVDGQISSIVSAFDGCAPCPEDAYLKLTCEAAEWSGAGTAESIKSLPAEMVVDYVRVYKVKPE